MYKSIITFVFVVFTLNVFSQKLKGSYAGLEKIENIIPSDTSEHWFHLTIITFKRNKIVYEQIPVSIKNNDTSYSSSDGGFYNYKGKYVKKDDAYIATIKLVDCDYCHKGLVKFTPPEIVSEEKINIDGGNELQENAKHLESKLLMIKSMSGNTILVNGNLYRKKN